MEKAAAWDSESEVLTTDSIFGICLKISAAGFHLVSSLDNMQVKWIDFIVTEKYSNILQNNFKAQKLEQKIFTFPPAVLQSHKFCITFLILEDPVWDLWMAGVIHMAVSEAILS